MSLTPSIDIYAMRGSVLVTAPAAEPVTVAEVKAALVIPGTADDSLIGDLITEAREEIENLLGLAMISQSWRLSLDSWPRKGEPWWDGVREGAISELQGAFSDVRLPVYPLQSITTVKTYDDADNETSVTVADVFHVDTYQRPGRLTLKSGSAWPAALRSQNAIQVVYVAGYGDDATDVPSPLRRAVRQMAAYMYEHRGDGCSTEEALKASGAAAAVDRYKVKRV